MSSVPPPTSPNGAPQKNLVIAVPTYNEKENVERLISEISKLHLDADILFVDDNSPDGTGAILDSLKPKYPSLHVAHRIGKLGIGSAHVFAIEWAYDRGYKKLLTMDCDFTHPPEKLPDLIAASPGQDIVVGSRYMDKNSLSDWNIFRKTLTHLGHFMTKVLLKMPYDATNALRLYDLQKIPRYAWDTVTSRGYAFFFESLYILHLNKFKISEVSIKLPSRTYGHSKMDHREIFRSIKLLFSTFLTTMMNRERYAIVEPLPKSSFNSALTDDQGWDGYWSGQTKMGSLLYDFVAAFYRKFIIRRTLNHFIMKNFAKKADVLHAGCGSGQVDHDIRDYVNITALDISPQALSFYRKTNQDHCKLLHGSIFAIPLAGNSIDGIYNLGVMEHFTETEIASILAEFHRVLKKNGRAVMFWPPEFGLSVVFFKVLTFVFKEILGRKDIKFHPDEITRVRSKAHVRRLVEAAHFSVVEYYFGIRDLFTYSVISIEKSKEA